MQEKKPESKSATVLLLEEIKLLRESNEKLLKIDTRRQIDRLWLYNCAVVYCLLIAVWTAFLMYADNPSKNMFFGLSLLAGLLLLFAFMPAKYRRK